MAAPPTTPQKLGAEFLGTAFLVYVGAGSAAATGVIAASTKAAFSMAQLGVISFAFMLVIVGAVYAIGHISGGHINPAVTISLAVSGKFAWREVPGYIAAQVAGAIAGAAAIYLTLGRLAAIAAGGGVTAYNPATMGLGRAMVIEAIGTFMLVFVIFGVIDHRAVPGWAPMAIGAIVFAVIIILGPATGAAINPARYFGAVSDAEGLRRQGAVVATACLPHRGIRRRNAGRPRVGRDRPGARRRGDDQPLTRSRHPATRKKSVEPRHEEAHQQPGNRSHRCPGGHGRGASVTVGGHREQGGHPRRRPAAGKVGLVSGGGSGHEPLHAGFVGYGMLDAACAGEVFTSPVPDQMLAATKAVNGGAGVLHIVKNYTGDVLNFQMAAEMAEDEGIEVVPVVINDDVAVQDSLYTAGRRGTGATVFVEKIAGALAEEGADLAAVAAVAREVNERSRSFGVALTSCVGARGGQADLRARRGRGGARHRHPRRARPDPGGPHAGP